MALSVSIADRSSLSSLEIPIWGSAKRINGAVESRVDAITIAGFVRCRKKVGHVICGCAKENLSS